MRELVARIFTLGYEHQWMSWVSHCLLAGLLALPFRLLGLGAFGFAFASGAYVLREIEPVVLHWARGGTFKGWDWRDALGDVVGALAGAGLVGLT